jgi:ribosomal protein L37AE/L43A
VDALNIAPSAQTEIHTNLVCLCCRHIQPVRRDQLPSRCEHCRESFAGWGYLLDDTGDAEELSQEVLDSRSISHASAARI